MHTSLPELIPAFLLSFCFSLLTLRYHSILPGLSIHITVNALFLGSTFLPEKYSWVILAAVGFMYLCSVYIMLVHKYKRVYVSRQRNLGYTLRLFLTTPSVFLAVVLMILQTAAAFLLYR